MILDRKCVQCFTILGAVFFYFYLPETKGKTLQEIEDYFSGRESSRKPSQHENLINNNNRAMVTLESGKLTQKQ